MMKKKKYGTATTATIVKKSPKFLYTSTCCSAPATKDACVRTPGQVEFDQLPLGHWNCSDCGRGCKVTRQPK